MSSISPRKALLDRLRGVIARSTAWHSPPPCTRVFPEYLRMSAPIPLSFSYAWLRRFHAPAHTTLVRTATQQRELAARGF